ncbi:MAG: transposase, partial [Nanoarchaeota archaeon]|nr:transposase [Nanoarchaeota archaeon]
MLQQIIQSNYNSELERELLNLFHSANLPLHFNHKGNKQFTNYQRISLIIIFRRENKSIRDFLDWLKESKWISWLGLKRIPGKSTLHDWLNLFDTKLIRELINFSIDKTNLKVTAIDGSGVDTNFKSSYYKKRLNDFGKETKNNYHKLDIIVDVYRKKQIIDYSFLLKNRHDSFVAKKLLKKIKFKKCKILADKGYPNYDFIEFSKIKQNNFISPPKNYGEKCRHDNFKRRRKIANFESNKKIYRRRVIVECVFSSLKRKQQLKLRSRLSYMKKREMGWHILFYNIRRNIVFDGNEVKENLSFYFLIFEIYVIPDKA